MFHRFIVAIFATLGLLLSSSFADEHTGHYADGEDVIFWVNTVGPYNNRQETYAFYQLPFCQGMDKVEHHHETMGEVLQGMELINMGIGGKFKVDIANKTLCESALNHQQASLFRFAIKNSYWYQMYVDNLPVWGFVGFMEDKSEVGKRSEFFLYTHKEFAFEYNNDQIILVNLTSTNPISLEFKETEEKKRVQFTYSIRWVPTSKDFANRFDRYLDHDFFEHKIHWFSIFNSFMMVIFLVGLVTVILLRTLRKDYARYDREEGLSDLDRDLGEEYGWKQVHGDVFRAPQNLMLLSACIGTGAQLAFLSLFMILIAMVFDLYTERSTILTVSIFGYALTAVISGIFSGSYYSKYRGQSWIKTMLLTATLWPLLVSVVTIYDNFIAIYKSTSRAIHFGTLVAILCIQFFIVFPLNLLGTVIGRNVAGKPSFPCRVNPIPRHIPEKQWYAEPIFIILLGGILPFGSIFIEMYFIFTSFWAYKIYYVYGFMLLVFFILVVVTACVTVVCTYFLLNTEDHRWHWISFFSAGSTSLYVFIYAIYYYYARTRMYGFYQTNFYFTYTGTMCVGLFLLLGTVGILAAERFIRMIYTNIKID